MEQILRMPDLATVDGSVTVLRWLVEPGSSVRRGEAIVEIETDKAVMPVESVAEGKLQSVLVNPGDRVGVGEPIAVLETEGAVTTIQMDERSSIRSPVTAPDGGGSSTGSVSKPSERGVGWLARNRAARAVSQSGPTSGDLVPLSLPRRTLVRRMIASQREVPHFYLQATADAESMRRHRSEAVGGPIAWDAYFVRASARALLQFPRMAFRFDGEQLVSRRTGVVNVAVDLDDELFAVPVEHAADRTIFEISTTLRQAVGLLRSGDPGARLTRGADLTITNLGSTGVDAFAAVITPPEACVLAVGRIRPEVVAVGDRVLIQHRVTLTLSVDHRVVNGKYAARFLAAIVSEVESP